MVFVKRGWIPLKLATLASTTTPVASPSSATSTSPLSSGDINRQIEEFELIGVGSSAEKV